MSAGAVHLHGPTKITYVDASSADQLLKQIPARAVVADVTGICKFSYKSVYDGIDRNAADNTVVQVLNAGVPFQIWGTLTGVYKIYKGGTDCTATIYLEDGSGPVIGLKIME